MKADGYSLDDKRQEISDNDIPDIISRFNNLEAESERKRTEQSFFVPVDEIVSNDYDLSINKYKEVIYEKVEYESTTVIMSKLEAIETEIQTANCLYIKPDKPPINDTGTNTAINTKDVATTAPNTSSIVISVAVFGSLPS